MWGKNKKSILNNENSKAYKLGQTVADNIINMIESECVSQLNWLKNEADTSAWNMAESENDLSQVVFHYCAALDGTHEYVGKLFDKINDYVRKTGLESDFKLYISERKLRHLEQIRTYLEFRLKLMMFPVGVKRENFRADMIASDLLHPSMAKGL